MQSCCTFSYAFIVIYFVQVFHKSVFHFSSLTGVKIIESKNQKIKIIESKIQKNLKHLRFFIYLAKKTFHEYRYYVLCKNCLFQNSKGIMSNISAKFIFHTVENFFIKVFKHELKFTLLCFKSFKILKNVLCKFRFLTCLLAKFCFEIFSVEIF